MSQRRPSSFFNQLKRVGGLGGGGGKLVGGGKLGEGVSIINPLPQSLRIKSPPWSTISGRMAVVVN